MRREMVKSGKDRDISQQIFISQHWTKRAFVALLLPDLSIPLNTAS
jgi:hypothetical protein